MVRVAIVVLALVVLVGHHVYGQEDSARLGWGKQQSEDLIKDTLLLKGQVLNNTKRIHVLQSRIPANTARTAALQELADENTNTINNQFGLLSDLNDTIVNALDAVQDEVAIPLGLNTLLAVVNQLTQIADIDSSLGGQNQVILPLSAVTNQLAEIVDIDTSSLSISGRKLMQAGEDRFLSPLTITTAKKCGEELAAVAAAIIKNNATISALETAYDGNEVDIATLEATVTTNEANLIKLIALAKELRDQLEARHVALNVLALRTVFFQNATGVTATEAINSLLNVVPIESTRDVAPGSRLPTSGNSTVDIVASCPTGWRLLSGGCSINYQAGADLANLQALFVDGPGVGAIQLPTFLNVTTDEDFTDNTVTCVPGVVAAGGSSATPITTEAYWSANATFSLQYTAEALCFENLPEITGIADYTGIDESLLIPPWVNVGSILT